MMKVRETLGLVFIIAALILVPAAWAFSRLLWMLAAGLLVIGSWLFYTDRMIKKEDRLTKETGKSDCSGRAVPTDIHDYTGWSSGGRSETMDSSFGADAGDGD